MDRLTERLDNGQASVKACGENCEYGGICVELDNSIFDCIAIEDIIDKLADYEDKEEQATAEWIPCSERLPEDGVDVLVWFEYFRYGEYNRLFQTTGISYTYNDEWSGFVNGQSGWSNLRIIAWMPLPDPYKSEAE